MRYAAPEANRTMHDYPRRYTTIMQYMSPFKNVSLVSSGEVIVNEVSALDMAGGGAETLMLPQDKDDSKKTTPDIGLVSIPPLPIRTELANYLLEQQVLLCIEASLSIDCRNRRQDGDID
jgi:hypothetical protein